MNKQELEQLWGETLRSPAPNREQFDRLAQGVVDTFASGDLQFRQHVKNRFNRVTNRTGQSFDPENFDLATARTFIADEIGFRNWGELIEAANDRSEGARPILFHYAVAAMDMGNFSALESTLGGPQGFNDQIVDWYEKGLFDNEPETIAEVFAAACMLGHEKMAAYLLDKGIDPYAGLRTGLAGFHYAASSGRLNVINLLIDRKVPMEIKNMYGGSVLGQAFWSAIYEYKPDHAAIIEALIDAGAVIEPGTLEWWEQQNVPSAETKRRVADALNKARPAG